jgi:hypothetical protein
MECSVSAWLNSRMRDDHIIKSELFATEDLARAALRNVLNRHKGKGRVVREIFDGPIIRFDIEDTDGFVGAYWLSDASGAE